MIVSCRKATAALLSCILIFLSFAAEFSHTHNLPARGVLSMRVESGENDGGKIGMTHNYSCVACQFAVSHFAVFIGAAIKVVATPASPITCPTPALASQFFFQLSSLRAPPAVLA